MGFLPLNYALNPSFLSLLPISFYIKTLSIKLIEDIFNIILVSFHFSKTKNNFAVLRTLRQY